MLRVYRATGQPLFLDQALSLATALETLFYAGASSPAWYPHARLNAGEPWPELGPSRTPSSQNGESFRWVRFVEGVGTVPDLALVSRVYEGQLADDTAESRLLFGQSYGVTSWTDRTGREVQANIEPESMAAPDRLSFAHRGSLAYFDLVME